MLAGRRASTKYDPLGLRNREVDRGLSQTRFLFETSRGFCVRVLPTSHLGRRHPNWTRRTSCMLP